MLIDNTTPNTEEIIKDSIMRIFEAEQSQVNELLGHGATRCSDKEHTADETFAIEQFKTHVEKKNGRYYLRPLFKAEFQPMKNNYHIALRRYNSLRNQLKKDPKLEEMYSGAIETMIKNKEVELVEEFNLNIADTSRYINYIPHMAVVKLDKVSTKCRPVFDASAKNKDGISLNSNFLSGSKTQFSISHLMIHLRMLFSF